MEGSADSDAPGTGGSATDSAARLARLLHRDCTRLLELYVSIGYGSRYSREHDDTHSRCQSRRVSRCCNALIIIIMIMMMLQFRVFPLFIVIISL